MKYHQDNGDWFALKKGFRWACCSCSLVHDVNVRGKNGQTEIQIVRNEKATAAMRRPLKRRVIIIDE